MHFVTSEKILLPLLLAMLLGAACAPARYAAIGQVAGHTIDTSVDGKFAHDYLEHYLPGERAREAPRLDAALTQADRAPLSNELLQHLTREFSVDLATLYFLDRTYRDDLNLRLQNAFFDQLSSIRIAHSEGKFNVPPEYLEYLLVFIPGYAYQTRPETGADFARQRRLLGSAGFDTVLVETDELGNVEPNARIIADDIARLSREARPIVLISASKGGAEAALALGRQLPSQQSRAVVAWLSIGGLLRGSPYADWAWKWPRKWVASIVYRQRRLDPRVIPNLRTQVRRAVFEGLAFPEHILLLQYVGTPLSGHIKKDVRKRYKIIRKIGPNDGLTLLLDEVISGSGVITDIGLDHYYRDPQIDLKTFALTMVMIEEVRRRSQMK